jgi:hypothetical protein
MQAETHRLQRGVYSTTRLSQFPGEYTQLPVWRTTEKEIAEECGLGTALYFIFLRSMAQVAAAAAAAAAYGGSRSLTSAFFAHRSRASRRVAPHRAMWCHCEQLYLVMAIIATPTMILYLLSSRCNDSTVSDRCWRPRCCGLIISLVLLHLLHPVALLCVGCAAYTHAHTHTRARARTHAHAHTGFAEHNENTARGGVVCCIVASVAPVRCFAVACLRMQAAYDKDSMTTLVGLERTTIGNLGPTQATPGPRIRTRAPESHGHS